MSSSFHTTGQGIAGAVVLYNPDRESLLQHINSYLPALQRLFVIDNSDNESGFHFSAPVNDKIVYIKNNGNLGIAAALNIAARAAAKEKFEWLLTMDQDAYFDAANLELYLRQFRENFYNDPSIAIVSPSTEKDEEPPVFKKGVRSITSGSIMRIAAYEATAGFDDALFIDEVDEDYTCKILLAGYQIVRISNVYMSHKLGEKRRSGLFNLFFVKDRTVHQPFRVYFMVRNYCYIRKKYGADFPELFKRRDGEFLTDLKNNVFFSGNFIQAGKMALKGYWHYRTKKIAATQKNKI